MREHKSRWSFTIGTVAQIPIRIHVTFVALLVWLVLASDSPSPLMEGLFVTLVFSCVLLHELGHALVAKRFDVQTRDITLYPFGGIASIVSQPPPRAELVIALAGPLVNLCIAGVLYPFITLPDLNTEKIPSPLPIPTRIFLTNVALAVFNLLPALPMDGGRVLRALLSLFKITQATKIAARVSQGLCVLLALAALWLEQPILFIIAIIVFLGAMQEHVRAETRSIAGRFSVKDAMIERERLEILQHGTTLTAALRIALTSWQPFFPVVNGSDVLGIISRDDLLEYSAAHSDNYIGEIMDRDIPTVDVDAPLPEACSCMEAHATPVLAVRRNGEFAGLLAYDKVTDFLFMNELRQHIPKDDDEVEWSEPL